MTLPLGGRGLTYQREMFARGRRRIDGLYAAFRMGGESQERAWHLARSLTKALRRP